MTTDDDRDDQRLIPLLRAVQADADPALWTRVRARIESRPRVPTLLLWAMRPAALAASLGLFLACAGLALVLATGRETGSSEDYATLSEALLAERDAEATVTTSATEPKSGAAHDSGSGR